MKLNDIRLDLEAIENGVWIDNIPKCGTLRLKVRGARSKKWREVSRNIVEVSRLSGPSEDDAEKYMTALYLQAGLVDWDGVERDDGEPIKFNVTDAEKILTDPSLVFFREGVQWAIDRASDRRLAQREADAKN